MNRKSRGAGTRKIRPLRDTVDEGSAADAAAMYPLLPVRPREVLASLPEFVAAARQRPARFLSLLGRLSSDQIGILLGRSELDVAAENDRFAHESWQSSGYHRRLAQSWLSVRRHLGQWVEKAEEEPVQRKRLEFYLNTLMSGLSPANFPATNPEVIENTLKTRGTDLVKGVARRWRDIRDNDGLPTQVDSEQFDVGRNLAITPGFVVYRNRVLELIQYTPATKKVYKTPVMLVSSFINRNYIFDLKPGRSTVQFLLEEGYSVFSVSWINPDAEMCDFGLDDYVQGVIDACEVVRKVTGAPSLNLTGLCGGGQICTLTASVIQAQRKRWINSLTLISYVIDPIPVDTDPGALCTSRAVTRAKREILKEGLYSASSLNWTLNMLQAERLLWNTVVDYYLLGKDPSTSEVMYWTNDQVNVPAKLACEMLDITYENPLAVAGELEVLGVPIDLKRLRMDSYHLGSYHDHLMPWHGMYRNGELFSGESEFVVTNGGHITPCITMPGNQRSRYFVNSEDASNAQSWLQAADERTGSWLSHWQLWLAQRSGSEVNAPKQSGNRKFPVLCDAPGEYVFS